MDCQGRGNQSVVCDGLPEGWWRGRLANDVLQGPAVGRWDGSAPRRLPAIVVGAHRARTEGKGGTTALVLGDGGGGPRINEARGARDGLGTGQGE
jgi:hypothetical protein